MPSTPNTPLIPENITDIDDDALTALDEQVAGRVEEIGEVEPGSLNDEDIAEIEALAEAREAIDTETQRRESARTERADRAATALSRARGSADEPEGEIVDSQVEPEEEDEEPAEAEEVTEDEEDAPEAIAAAAGRRTSPAVPRKPSALARRRPASAKPRPAAPREFMFATPHALAVPEGTPFGSTLDVAKAIVKKRQSFTRIPSGVTDERLAVATGLKTLDHRLGHDAMDNFVTLGTATREHEALVASGAFCTPQTPLYDFFRLAEPQSPVEEGLNSVGAPRGGIRFIAATCSTTVAASGIGINSNPKPCVHVDCPTVSEVTVDAVSQCVEFGNLQYRTFPEQVENFLEDVAVAFASRKEVYYLDFINTNSTAVTAATAYGARRGLLFDWTVAAVSYRKRRGMRRAAPLEILLPDWAMDAVKLDIALDADDGTRPEEVSDAQVLSMIRNLNLEPVWYNDAPTAHSTGANNQKWNAAQGAGALNTWPGVVVAYLFAPGTFVRLDGGTLDVGLVRDSSLNATNDLQLFMEEWLGMAKLGCESIKLVSNFCVNGAGPERVPALTC